ncbi:MAG: aromatic acid exporter family protein [Thermomicrobiales bacterium]
MRAKLILIVEYLTGVKGPLRSALDWFRAHGLGERVIKSALAAVIAWLLAGLLPDNPAPILAPLTAIFSINLTIAGSMRDAVQRVLGVVFGILLAVLISEYIGANSWAIFLVILISFYVGRRLGLDPSGIQQIAVSALLIVLGAASKAIDDAAVLHLANTLIGTGVGLLLNASVAPPNHLPDARRRLLEVGEAIQDDLRMLAEAARTGISNDEALTTLHLARETNAELLELDTALNQARESLQFNLLGRRQRDVLGLYHQADLALEHASIQTRMIARALADATAQDAPLGWLLGDALGAPLADLLDMGVETLDAYLTRIREGDLTGGFPIDTDRLTGYQAAIARRAADFDGELRPGGWIYLGEVVALATQLITDLSTPTDQLERVPNVESFELA